MTRATLFLAGTAALAVAVPVTAQPVDHSSMPGMTMPAEPKPAATPQSSSPPQPEPTPMPDMSHGGMDMKPKEASCAPEHAAMGHCTPEAESSGKEASGAQMPNMDAMDHGTAVPSDPDCPPEHAKMAFIGFNLAEYQARKGRDGFRWDGEAWYGGDISRLTLKSEGEGVFGEGIEETETQLLYSRAVGPYFNAQAGIRQDLGPGPDRTYATVGFEGLAPYWFEVEGALFLSHKGDLHGRLEGYYDQRITQRLDLQPMAEVNFALQDVPEIGVGSGLSDMELGLRLRYEIVKEFAPYVGVEWARKVGDTARFARAAGDDADSVSWVMGVRASF